MCCLSTNSSCNKQRRGACFQRAPCRMQYENFLLPRPGQSLTSFGADGHLAASSTLPSCAGACCGFTAAMDRVRRDPAGIDLGDVFSLGPKPMKTMNNSGKTNTPQRQPLASAATSGLSSMGSQLDGLGAGGAFGSSSSTPAAKRPTAASGRSTYQLDPFAELSLSDKPPQHRPMASRYVCFSTWMRVVSTLWARVDVTAQQFACNKLASAGFQLKLSASGAHRHRIRPLT
jgi:hypothetical protein